MNVFQIIFSLIIVILLFRLIRNTSKISKNNLDIIALPFFIILGLIVILFPDTSTVAANFFGIQRGADFIIYTSIIIGFFAIYKLYIQKLTLEKKLKEIATKIALLEKNE